MLNAVRAEWIKFRSVRSSVVLALVIVLISVAPAILVASLSSGRSDGRFGQDLEQRLSNTLVGVQLSQLLIGVLAALMITQEYRFSTIRATLAASPHRPRVYSAKGIALLAITAVASATLLLVSVGLAAFIYKQRDIEFVVGNASALRLIGGTILLLASYALACFGIGAIVRSSAAAIVLGLAWPLVVEPATTAVFNGLKHESWSRWLPFTAGGELVRVRTDEALSADHLGPWAGWTYFTLFALALVGLGYWLFQRRDA